MVVLAGVVRMYYELGYRSIEHVKVYDSRREQLFVIIVGLCFTIPGAIYLFTPWLNFALLPVGDFSRVAASLLMFLNIVFFWWIHRSLGENWSPVLEIRKEQSLITSGPYKYIRHPMYTCFFIHAITLVFVSANWVVGLMGLLSFGFIYPFRVRTEERMMLDTFGEQYFDYMKRTGRLFPKLFQLAKS